MSVKTIVAVFDRLDTTQAVGDTAIALALENGAHIIGIHGEIVDPPPMISPFDLPDSSVITALYEAASEKRQQIGDLFSSMMSKAGVSFEWRPVHGSSGAAIDAMVESARTADLVIASQPAVGHVGDLDDVLYESGRPVLFIPWINKSYRPARRILVAWDGSREAARAVFDSMPLLMKAGEVEILSVDPKETRRQSAAFTGAEIAATLARHGLKVNAVTQASEGLPVSAVIENRCSDFSADLLVMGAYSHARIRERIFGGVTQVLLETMTVPVLMSR